MKIDTSRMTQGMDVAIRLRGSRPDSIPWMVILDAEGEKRITSDGPDGNIGYPFEPQEIEYFLKMLQATAKRMGSDDIAQINQALKQAAEEYRKPQG